jgi:branched-subunit amino acid aminotransferase/4-amino-4-deoxychorismate lyase
MSVGIQESIFYRLDTMGSDGFVLASQYANTFPLQPSMNVLHYGTSGFEGILGLRGDDGAWRIPTFDENLTRFMNTLDMLFIRRPGDIDAAAEVLSTVFPELKLDADQSRFIYIDVDEAKVRNEIFATLAANIQEGHVKLDTEDGLIYIRPNAYRAGKVENNILTHALGVASLDKHAVIEIMAQNVKSYLSSTEAPTVAVYELDMHQRIYGRTQTHSTLGFANLGRQFKLGGNYATGGMAKNLSIALGLQEGLLTDGGYVLEGGGENVFAIIDGKIYTPPTTQAILPGTKRSLVIDIARSLGYEVIEEPIAILDFINADAVAFSGTWTGFEPVGKVIWPSKVTESKYDAKHPIIGHVRDEYQNLLRGRESLDSSLDHLKNRVEIVDLARYAR